MDFCIPETSVTPTVEALGDKPLDEAAEVAYDCASLLACALARLDGDEHLSLEDQSLTDAVTLMKDAYLRAYHLAGRLQDKQNEIAPRGKRMAVTT